MDNLENDEQIKRFLAAEKASIKPFPEDKHRSAMARARFNLGQQDTIVFAFVRVWASLAKMLAPIFAFLAVKHARQHNFKPSRDSHKDSQEDKQ